ncbi:MAG: NAD(P)-dependent oxidoreductase [Acidilobaceae archaeon]|nr:NAD(P)-dependent oxidoreductase [Acidilobaceae archaeon]MCX8166184.1 NAD(P)-dependent oxidoreductase [Acidilobaceae archaeon]MDW7974822.1 NAD(P)-dependent oxidoreductase [Sulfolobales archaeon]
MRAVIPGGIGFLGANLAEVLSAQGHEIVVVGRKGSEKKRPQIAAHLEKIGARLALLPRVEEKALAELGGDVYFYLIGKLTGSLQEFREAHVTLLEETARAAASIGARVVHVSSIGAIGGIKGLRPGSTVYEEEEHLSGERQHWSFYEVTKAEGERALVRMGKELKGRWSILRPGFLIGGWGYHPEWRLFRRALPLRLAPRFGIGLPIVHVRDVAEILVEAGEGKYDGKWLHVVSPYYPEIGDLVMSGCRQTNRRCLPLPLQPFGWLGAQLAPLLLRLVPRGTLPALTLSQLRFRYRYASRILKREWRPVDTMVRDVLFWQ